MIQCLFRPWRNFNQGLSGWRGFMNVVSGFEGWIFVLWAGSKGKHRPCNSTIHLFRKRTPVPTQLQHASCMHGLKSCLMPSWSDRQTPYVCRAPFIFRTNASHHRSDMAPPSLNWQQVRAKPLGWHDSWWVSFSRLFGRRPHTGPNRPISLAGDCVQETPYPRYPLKPSWSGKKRGSRMIKLGFATEHWYFHRLLPRLVSAMLVPEPLFPSKWKGERLSHTDDLVKLCESLRVETTGFRES